MSRLQRIITVIMVMVFTPAAVLAGTSLRYCQGADGHHGIEFVLVDSAHHSEVSKTGGPTASATLNDGKSCVDRPVLSVGDQSQRIDQFKLKLAADHLAAVIPFVVTGLEVGSCATSCEPSAAEPATDPRLADRETVVLLI